MADGDFGFLDFSGTMRVYTGDASDPIELDSNQEVALTQLPFDLHLHAQQGQSCAIVLPVVAGGEEVTLLFSANRMDLRLKDDGISFVVPTTGERVLISGGFSVGDDLTVRPLMAAPTLPEVCMHGISPIGMCPLNPP